MPDTSKWLGAPSSGSLSPALALPSSFALPAERLWLAVDHAGGAVLRHGMTLLAGLLPWCAAQFSASSVLPTGDRFEVGGIDTGTVPAQVVDDEAVGYGTDVVQVGDPVCHNSSAAARLLGDADQAVPVVVQVATEDPAPSLLNSHSSLYSNPRIDATGTHPTRVAEG